MKMKRFFIYGLIGWCIEIIWTGLGSLLSGNWKLEGFTNLWMFLVYGLAVFLEPIHDVIREWRWPFRGIIWVVIIWGIEYTTGLIMGNILGFRPWVYAGSYAIDQLVRIDFAPAWFIAGLIFERIHYKLDAYGVG